MLTADSPLVMKAPIVGKRTGRINVQIREHSFLIQQQSIARQGGQ
ncbi:MULTISPECIES: hypothetical protein [Caballeronia]|jgi:hypothetical protein|nr:MULTISPECIES: hypothetical protein [Caballeronia]